MASPSSHSSTPTATSSRLRSPKQEHNPAMRARVVVVVLAIVVAIASSGFAQTTSARSSARAPAGKSYIPARTPWGDPDLQGTFTNSNEYATPLERPARFAGRTLGD